MRVTGIFPCLLERPSRFIAYSASIRSFPLVLACYYLLHASCAGFNSDPVPCAITCPLLPSLAFDGFFLICRFTLICSAYSELAQLLLTCFPYSDCLRSRVLVVLQVAPALFTCLHPLYLFGGAPTLPHLPFYPRLLQLTRTRFGLSGLLGPTVTHSYPLLFSLIHLCSLLFLTCFTCSSPL